jgi:hypothetical protein
MPIRRRTCLAALMFAPTALLAEEAPAEIAGVAFDRRVRIAGAELLLNGTGVRAVAWIKGYAAALYLRERVPTAAQAVAMPGPKRLKMVMLQNVSSEEFVKAFNKGVSRNSNADELPRLAARMDVFAGLVAAIGQVHKGDVVDLDLDPGRGLIFSLNGKLRGEPIAGDDFYASLLRAFVGEQPYDEKLKAGLLGHAPA